MRTKRLLCLAAVMLVRASPRAILAQAAVGSPDDPRLVPVLSSADTMESIFREEPLTPPAVRQLTIEAARNEIEGMQLLVAAPPGEGLHSVHINVTNLAGPGQSIMGRQNVTWRLVGYVQTEKPAYPAPRVGWWPDPLLPAVGSFDVLAGQVQPIWINVHVPDDAKAGTYRGSVNVKAGSGPIQNVPLEVRVWDFALPHQQHLETCFLLSPESLQRFYKLPKVPIELYERWIDFCLSYRISVALYEWPDYQKDMERLAARQLDQGGSAFGLGVD